MKRLAVALLVTLMAVPAWATSTKVERAEKRFETMLQRIDPSERLEQVCEYAALTRIGRDKNAYHPDRVVIQAISPPKVSGDKMSGSGAALRSKGKWYQFGFTCQAAPDRLKVLSFSYDVGHEIPEEQWDKLGLWR
ncbi:MAG TPA: DUF930 domain-containing protein [Pseudolabrys sp.]|jgi:hypothetical protein|nr:DUF930 domain-containing protein [Pseudolabrys sp.]